MSSSSYDSHVQDEAKTPILTTIYNVAGGLWIVVGAIAVFLAAQDEKTLAGGVAAAAIAVFMALVCFGIAQVVMLIAKIEFNTRATDSSYQMVKLLTQISRNTTAPSAASREEKRG